MDNSFAWLSFSATAKQGYHGGAPSRQGYSIRPYPARGGGADGRVPRPLSMKHPTVVLRRRAEKGLSPALRSLAGG